MTNESLIVSDAKHPENANAFVNKDKGKTFSDLEEYSNKEHY